MTKLEISSKDGQSTTINLGPSAYVVLGLIARIGPCTPYDLKQAVSRSVAFFWDFPQSQLYVEPPRLAQAGLLKEQREEHGRRRRIFSLTNQGRSVLKDWLESSSDTPTEVRDVGLLKLSFGGLATTERLLSHAEQQLLLHQSRRAQHAETRKNMEQHQQLRPHQVTVLMGERFEQAFVDFWQSILDDPPEADPNLTTL